jgi:hypothetical protein
VRLCTQVSQYTDGGTTKQQRQDFATSRCFKDKQQSSEQRKRSVVWRIGSVEVRGGKDGGGTTLQAGGPMVSLGFLIDIIIPAVLWSLGQMRL